MKPDASIFLNQIPQFESRNEVDFFLFCYECDIKVQPHPLPISGWNEAIWSPDFYLPQFQAYVELKPIPYWHETSRIKPIVYAAIQSGQKFWTWFCTMKGKVPKICEWTNYDPANERDPIIQMQRFILCDPPISFGPVPNEDKQLYLF
jgi:hypothetical protein